MAMNKNQSSAQRPWKSSYHPKTQHDIREVTAKHIPEVIRKSAQEFPKKAAFTNVLPNGMSKTMTYAEADRLSDAFAAYLRDGIGLQPGDRVAIQMPNCLAYPIAVFGILKAGCIAVNTNPLYTPEEMKHQFKDSGATVLILIDLFADKLEQVLPSTSIKKVILTEVTQFFDPIPRFVVRTVQKYLKKQIPTCRTPVETFSNALEIGQKKLVSQAQLDGYLIQTQLDSVCALQYTGGTTGVSKGAMLSHRNLLVNVDQAHEMFCPLGEVGKESVMTALPLYHIFAFTINLLLFHRLGAHNVMVPSPRPLANLKRAFEKFPITFLPGVNTLFNGLINEPWFAQNPPKFLKASVAGGMALQAAVAKRWVEVARSPILEGYGLTESSPVLTFNPIGAVQSDSIGIPIPTTDIECRDDQGQRVPDGEPGELCAKGPQIMLGYWNRPDETAKVIKDGWLYTGDIAIQDSKGFFKIVDRKKDMILVSGFNVYPNELEDAIAKHPGVLEVAVIGVPDDASGEAVKAFIVKRDPALTPDDVKKHCRELLTGYKQPRHIEFRTELPKSPVGKILRKELRPKK
jgi:long-chain acyl-CoA synthetase